MSAYSDYLDLLISDETVLSFRLINGDDHAGPLVAYVMNDISGLPETLAIADADDAEPIYFPYHAVASFRAAS